MRTNFLFTIALATSSVVFAQKKEVKAIEKSIKSNNFVEAKSLVAPAEAMLDEMDDKLRDKFMLLKGQAYLGVDNRNAEDLEIAASAFSKLQDSKYKDQAIEGLTTVVSSFVNGAIEDQNTERYSEAAFKLERAYDYSKKDTVYLYYAASNAVNSKDYDSALRNYEKLRELKFSGSELKYYAIDKEAGEEIEFANKSERDVSVMAKTHINPTERLSESKSAEIAKNIALIYISQGDNDKALEAMAVARKENPDDILLLRSEGDIYLQMKRMDKYEEVIKEVLKRDPNNPELYYNLGVGADQQGNKEKAISYYKKAVELNPQYAAAYNNIAVLILSEEKELVNQMNNLGTSKADNLKYDELKIQRENVYKNALPYLEKALDAKKDYLGVAQSLYGIYEQLGMTSKADAMKVRIESMKSN